MLFMDYSERSEKYRVKAEELRAVADSMTDPLAKKLMRDVAADYLQMARTLGRLAEEHPPPNRNQ